MTVSVLINGIKQIDEKIFLNDKGNIYHFLKKTDKYYENFAEIYFTKINYNQIKGWKKHTLMTMNLIVPVGNVEFVFYDDVNKEFKSIIIGDDNYKRLYVPKGVWFAFRGINTGTNLIANFSNILHDDSEVKTQPLEKINYNWNKK
tara:strand:+ start:72 stop:509 length:438 start_codon:yes stop_codon:yes gene_type:complete